MNLKAFEKTQEIPEVLRVILEGTQALVSKNKGTQYGNFRLSKRSLEEKAAPQQKKKSSKKRCKHLELDGADYLSPLSSAFPSPASSAAPSPSPCPTPTPRPESPVDPSATQPNLQPHRIVNSSDIPTQPLVDLPNAPSFDPEEFKMPDQFTNSCTRCNTLPEDEQCIRRFAVDELAGYEQYEGCVITTAPPEDRLPPMVSFQHAIDMANNINMLSWSREARSVQNHVTITLMTSNFTKSRPAQRCTSDVAKM